MRIISGKYRGRSVIAPGNLPARPTTDFAKEGLFNILNNNFYFEEIRVLDLFAGTGNITYELISRGVMDITCVELDSASCRFIKKTLETWKEENTARVFTFDVFKFLKNSNDKFDLIFADPPYELEGIEKIPQMVFENGLLKEGGMLVLEHSNKTDFSAHPAFDQRRHYGKVNFSMYTQDKFTGKEEDK